LTGFQNLRQIFERIKRMQAGNFARQAGNRQAIRNAISAQWQALRMPCQLRLFSGR
jgi:hypothetical protein